jgi:hypothetical protein
VLDVLSTLDGSLDVFVLLKVDQPFDRVLLRKSGHQPISMFVDATNEIAGHPT